MANYIFENMTAAQAASFNGASDTLTFGDTAATAGTISVSYINQTTAPSATDPGGTSTVGVVLTDTHDGVSVTFGAAATPMLHIAFTSGDNSTLFIGGQGADDFHTAPAGINNFEYGGLGADTLSAGGGASLLQGNGGGDSLIGGTGHDTLYGGQGDDVISLGADKGSLVNGNLGNDTIAGASGTNDTLFGGQGDDSIVAGSGNDLVNGNLGNDIVTSAAGTDTLYGGQGNDLIVASGTNDLVNGNIGNDTISIGDAGAATLHGGQGNDVIFVTDTGKGAIVFGDLGDDTIVSSLSTGNDTLLGGDGNDSLSATAGGSSANAYSIDGGAGVNTISVTQAHGSLGDTITAGDGVGGIGNTITLHVTGAGNDLITSGAGNDSIFDNFAAGTGKDTINAGAGDNLVTGAGHAGALSIVSGGGADTITGGAGNDTISTGDGNDVVTLGNGSLVHLTVGAGTDTITAGTGQDIITKSSGGNDIFHFAGHGVATQGLQDAIIGWNGGTSANPADKIDFGGTVGGHVTAVVDTASVTDYATAVTEADNQVHNHGYNVVALQVGTDVVVFADSTADGHITLADQAVVLIGRSLSDVHTGNII